MSSDEADHLKEMLGLQLVEVEMLASMFPYPGEFSMDSKVAQANVQDFVDGTFDYEFLQHRIGFTIKVSIDDSQNHRVELAVQLPHLYPDILPEVFLRTLEVNREAQHQMNEDLKSFVSAFESGEICIGAIVNWLQEHGSEYVTKTVDEVAKTSKQDTMFTRLWIYSHHIYSKTKRREILDWGHDLKVNGFMLPGKPGVICIEGTSSLVEELWFRIRRMNWKKIAVKEKEEVEMGDKSVDCFQKFEPFKEICFEVRGGKGREYHMDLGQFCQFLEQRGCEKIFSLYFGVAGKTAS